MQGKKKNQETLISSFSLYKMIVGTVFVHVPMKVSHYFLISMGSSTWLVAVRTSGRWPDASVAEMADLIRVLLPPLCQCSLLKDIECRKLCQGTFTFAG